MNRIKRKLNSERGASITWALLIFLVCAVIGSAVLVAGTTASGRMSNITENDQRYYAVNSAARVLCDNIPERTVTVEETTVVSDDSETTTYKLNGVVIDLVSNITSFSDLAAYQFIQLQISGDASSDLPELSLDTYLESPKKEALAASITGKVYSDGRLVLEISKGTGSNKYKLKLTFNVEQEEPQKVLNENGYTITRTMKWKLSDIESVH